MSDFHRSLDRALGGLVDPSARVGWRDPQVPNIAEIQERINEAIKQAAIVSNAFAVRRDPAYDDSYLRDTGIVDSFPLPAPGEIEVYANAISEYVTELARRCTLPPATGPTHWYDRIDCMGTE